MESQSDAETTPFLSLAAALSYGFASMAMVFINKAVLMQYAHSMTLLTLQQLATTLLIHFGRVMGYTKAKGVNMETAKKLFPVSLFYNANVAFALASLKGVNIPMYIALKRLTPLAVLIAGFFSGKGRPTTQVSLSVTLTAAGVIIAALGDFSFDLFGYSMALTSVFFQTMYLVLVEKSGAEDGLSSIEIMFYNSFLSLPFLLVLIVITGEFPNSLSLLFAKLLLIFGYAASFTGDGHCSQLHHVPVHHSQLCPNDHHCWGAQRGWVNDPRFHPTRWGGNTCFECEWIGYQHSWWVVVFICQISAKEEQASKVRGRCGGSS
ncbi:UDP-galactose/UDP-glucose transporter 7 isoform X2 [Malania oleifera]|uniref:UDP-galactose/UDP-glucose transporter 7 isoform X2 n=1 Tax=Malania oleifera TaxID=397392 RepID=UPI0025ADBB02|nr:UDP-galactose/UDP-glucose transporter 7 isoform X2 [Malania oleifera]XP_057958286.1 UDP-galactose/UDP-glucose transporter 7 isoform X2 [Malania oleifera]